MSNKLKKKPRPILKKTKVNLESRFLDAFTAHQAGLLGEATRSYEEILAIDQNHAGALNLLGLIAQQKGDFARAVTLALRAVAQRTEGDFLCNLGSAYRGLRSYPEAIGAFQRALRHQPDHRQAQFNLALTLLDAGDLVAAGHGFKQILRQQPKMVPALEGLGRVLLAQGEFRAAVEEFTAALIIAPHHSTALILKGLCLHHLKMTEEALLCYQEALRHSPGQSEALNNIGNILAGRGEFHAALDYYQQAVVNAPEFLEANINLAWTLLQHGFLPEALAKYRAIVQLWPDLPAVHSDLLFTMNYDPQLLPEEFLAAANQWWQRVGLGEPAYHYPQSKKSAPTTRKQQAKKLRIGFLSPDFRNHPVGTFLSPLLSKLADQEVELFCYAEMEEYHADETTAKIRAVVGHWYKTYRQSNATVARRIYEDDLDLLIDLAGHSAHNRLGVLAHKPAPIQASWLGYVNTTGLPVIDYRLTDALVDPEGSENQYCEALIRLPHGFFCYEPPANAPPVSPLPARQCDRITFGSFNNLAKINERVIAVWAQILRRLPNARLLMVSQPLGDPFIGNRYRQLFADQGADPAQLQMVASLPMQEYLALYNDVDLALDPFPHNGHTITCHTLWMGVPVIALQGDRYAGRMAASILTRLGLENLIATSPGHYVELACQLATDLNLLSTLRAGLRQRLLASPMCDCQQFGADFLAAVATMVGAPNLLTNGDS